MRRIVFLILFMLVSLATSADPNVGPGGGGATVVDDLRVALAGLVPDESSDLERAISATPAGGTVELEARNYRLSKSVDVTARTNLVIRGKVGTRFVLRFDPEGDVGDNANGFKFVRCENIRLENLAFTTSRST